VLLYIERWLKAPVQMEDGQRRAAPMGTPQGGGDHPAPGEPVPALRVDMWMGEAFPPSFKCPRSSVGYDAICPAERREARQRGRIVPTAFCGLQMVLSSPE